MTTAASTASRNPAMDAAYALRSEQVTAYRRDGHVLLEAVASPAEIAAYRPLIQDYVRRHNRQTTPLAERDTYHKAFLQIANLWENDAEIARFTFAARFARIAAELMGVSGVRLYHDQALFKEPGGGPTPWHQDQYYWPLDTSHTITMWMPLVDVSLDMGPVIFAGESHREGPICSMAISDDSDRRIQQLVAERRFPIAQRPLCAGDATFHAGWTLHAAPGNQTSAMREVMTVIYYADGTRLLEPDNPHRPADLARWFPGQKPGELAGGPLTPLLYPVPRA